MSPYEVGELPHLFDPMLTIALEGGPMKTIPSSAKRSANLAFSLKNPYLVNNVRENFDKAIPD